jgi:hypothetical protein
VKCPLEASQKRCHFCRLRSALGWILGLLPICEPMGARFQLSHSRKVRCGSTGSGQGVEVAGSVLLKSQPACALWPCQKGTRTEHLTYLV